MSKFRFRLTYIAFGRAGVLILAVSLTVAGKISSFFKEVLLSFFFGVGPSTDAYFIANIIPGLIWAAVSVTTNLVFLPLYVKRRAGSEPVDRFVNEAVAVYGLAAIALTVACAFAAGPIVRFTASDAAPSTLALARQLTLIMSVGFLFSGYVGLQNAVQQAHGKFIVPLTVPVVNNLIAAVGIMIGAQIGGIRVAVAAAVLGWVVQAPIQRLQTRQFYAARLARIRRETFNRLLLLSAPVMLGVLLDQLNIYVGIYLASGFGPGAISHLNYGSRLANFLAGIFSWLVAYFLFPRVASAAARNNTTRLGATAAIGFALMGALTAPLAVIALLSSHDVIALVYGRGAYKPADVAVTALVFACYSYGIVFIAFREMLNRIFFSYQLNYVPLLTGIVATVANLSLSYLLSRSFGVSGIALGASAAAFGYAAIEFAILFIWKPALLRRELVIMLGAVFVAAIVAFAAGSPIVALLGAWHPLMRLITVGIGIGAIYSATLMTLLMLFGIRPRNLIALWHMDEQPGNA